MISSGYKFPMQVSAEDFQTRFHSSGSLVLQLIAAFIEVEVCELVPKFITPSGRLIDTFRCTKFLSDKRSVLTLVRAILTILAHHPTPTRDPAC
jgi:hypothetical protein